MKAFQLEPTDNIALINVILDKCASLGYKIYGDKRENFNDPDNWFGDSIGRGQYIFCGCLGYVSDNTITRDDNPTKGYQTLSLEQFFKLTPEDCQSIFPVELSDNNIYTAKITKKSVVIPYAVEINRERAIGFAKKILEIMQ